MRFGSIRAFLNFIIWLEGIGYKRLSPLYDIEEGLKHLPHYISNYQCELLSIYNGMQISLRRDKAVIWYIVLEKNNEETQH